MLYFSQYAHWLIRLMIAATFIYHSWGKFLNLRGFASAAGLPLPLAFLPRWESSQERFFAAGGFYKPWLTRLAVLPLAVIIGSRVKISLGTVEFSAESVPSYRRDRIPVISARGLYLYLFERQ
jgi:uncharacterized membrane protein YphA (DoxX/SURF4 family)